MKLIKYILVIALIFQVTIVDAQNKKTTKKYELEVKNIENSTLELVNLSGNVTIATNNSSKIIIEASNIEPKPKRADGLKRIGSGGEDNTGVGLNYTDKGNNMTFFGAISMSSNVNYKISIPKNLKISVELGMFSHGDLEISGLTSSLELDVKTSDVKLREITGPTVISSLSGDIDIVFSKLNQTSPFSIKAISGDIDISMPANTPANIALASMSGSIFSDFNIKPDNGDSKNLTYVGGGSKVKAQLNNGGVKVLVTVMSGNIYLRKKK